MIDAVASPQKKKYPHLLGLNPGVDSVVRPVSKEKFTDNERTSHFSTAQPSVEKSESDAGPMRRLGKGCLTMLAVLCFGLAMKFVAKVIIAGMSAGHETKLPEPIHLEPDPLAPGKYRVVEKWGDTKEIETVLVATLEIIKRALSMQFTQKQLKEVVDKVAALDTANSRRTFENPSPEKCRLESHKSRD